MTYDHVTTDMFDGALESIVDGMTAAQILAIPGTYEVLSEALNNDVLSTFDESEGTGTPGTGGYKYPAARQAYRTYGKSYADYIEESTQRMIDQGYDVAGRSLSEALAGNDGE